MKYLVKLLAFVFFLSFFVQLVAAQDMLPQPGDKIIVAVPLLPVHVRPDDTSAVAANPMRGTVTRIIALQNDESGDVWLYLDSWAHGWVKAILGGQPTTTLYSDALLVQMIAEATTTLQANPQDVESYLLRATLYEMDRNFSAALIDIDQAIVLAPDDGRLHERRGNIHMELNQYEEAYLDFTNAQGRGWTSPYLIYRYAFSSDLWLGHGASLTEYVIATRQTPDYGFLYVGWGSALYNMGYLDDALNKFTQAIEADPLSATGYDWRATVYIALGNYEAALNDLEQGLSIDPACIDCYVDRATLYSEFFRNHVVALQDYEAALALDATDDRIFSNRATTYVAMGEIDLAIDDLKHAIELDPTSDHAYYTLAALYGQVGEYSSALDAYSSVVNMGIRFDNSALLYRAQIYIAVEDYYGAIGDLTTYLRVMDEIPENQYFRATAHLLRGRANLQTGAYLLCIEDYEDAVALGGSFVQAYYDLGAGYRVTPLRESLIAEIQAQIDSTPVPDLYLELGNMQMEFGLWADARESYLQYLSMTSDPVLGLREFVTAMDGLLW